jgi:hypothetical protein
MATRHDIYAALAQKADFEVVTDAETTARLRFAGRCHPQRWSFFCLVIFELNKLNEGGEGVTCDISKQYINQNGRLLYSWRIIFQHPELANHYQRIVDHIRRAPLPARSEVNEVLLPGYKHGDVRGGVNAKGKGASVGGSAPMIVTGRGR